MSMSLVNLSLSAHEQALTRGALVPAERLEFMHLPMTRVNDIPVFDGSRMSPPQIEDTVERLERITGRAYARGVRESVADYMQAYGRFGLRVKDLCEALDASKPIILRYLRELVEAGHVAVREEKTRGAGSARKRYVWLANRMEFGREDAWSDDPDDDPRDATMSVKNDEWAKKEGPGIIHHWTTQGEFSGCTSGCCRGAVQQMIEAEQVSAARQAGGSGFAEGLVHFTRRRVAAQRAEQAAFDRALAASGWVPASNG